MARETPTYGVAQLVTTQEEIPGVLGHHETTVSQNKHFRQTFSVPNVFFEIAADSFLL
jgi:hypothetical protein